MLRVEMAEPEKKDMMGVAGEVSLQRDVALLYNRRISIHQKDGAI